MTEEKKKKDFKVKDSDQRYVTIPDDLADRLRRWKKLNPGVRLIMGTESDKPNTHMLRELKRFVWKTKLACGICEGCLSKNHECQEWYLHKFRATCITHWLRSGLDLATVMQLSGHSDLESVQRYLIAASGAPVLKSINTIPFGREVAAD